MIDSAKLSKVQYLIDTYRDAYDDYAEKLTQSDDPSEVVSEFRLKYYPIKDNLKQIKDKLDVNDSTDKVLKKRIEDLFYDHYNFTEFSSKKESLNEELQPVPENIDIIQLSSFKKAAGKLKLNDNDIEELKLEMRKRGPKAELGNKVYKFEWWPKRFKLGKKEGRVIYIEYIEDSKIWLSTIYKKNEKKDLTLKEKEAIIKLSNILRGDKK